MKYMLPALAIVFAQPSIAGNSKAPSAPVSFGSARTAIDIQKCLAPKLADLGTAAVTSAAQVTTLTYGHDESRVIVEITEGDDVRLVTVSALRKLGARQDDIRS